MAELETDDFDREDKGQTAKRPALTKEAIRTDAARRRQMEAEQGQRRGQAQGARRASSRQGQAQGGRRRPASGPAQGEQRRQGSRPVQGGTRRPASHQAQGRQRRPAAHSSQEGQRRRPPAQGKASHAQRRQPNPPAPTNPLFGVRVPLLAFIIALLVCGVAFFFVGRCTAPKVAEVSGSQTTATTEAAESSSNVSSSSKSESDSSSSSSSSSTSADSDSSSSDSSSTATESEGGVEDPWLTSGTFTTGDSTLDEEVKAYCDERVSSDQDLDEAALKVYTDIAWSDYVERDDAQNPSGADWRIQYARQYYENNCSGNCYEFAPFLAYCLQYLGFEDAKAEGVIVELESGSWGDHGLVYVTNTDGTACLCDTSLGTNGWMLDADSYNVQIQDFTSA